MPPEDAREHQGGKAFDQSVVGRNRSVEQLTPVRDLVLGICQSLVKNHKKLVRFELRIVLGENEYTGEQLRECILSHDFGIDIAGSQSLGPQRRDGFENILLMSHVATADLDETRDLVVALFQRDVDVRERPVGLLGREDHLVVGADDVEADSHRGQRDSRIEGEGKNHLDT